MRTITSRDNPLVKRLRGLAESPRERRESGKTLLDGAHLVAGALAAGVPILEWVVSEQGLVNDEIGALLAANDSIPLTCLPDGLFAQISPVDSPSGLLAVIEIPAPSSSVVDDSLVVLDGVQDPGNLGTILRTAAAAGIRRVLLTQGCAQAWSPRALRAGMGGHFRLEVQERVDAPAVLDGYPGRILATALETGAQSLYALDLRGPVAWLFGSEGAGLSDEVAALATDLVRIPMPGVVESLNVGAAAAVCLFEQVRQRGGDVA